MQLRTLILCYAGVAAVITVAIVSSPTRYAPGSNVSTSFIGYTNGAAGRLAMVSVSNACGITLRGDFYFFEEVNQARLRLGPSFRLPSTSLAPTSSQVLSLQVPNGSGPWRARFYFSPDNLQRKLSDRYGGRRFVPEWLGQPPSGEWTLTGWIDR
jgi:hypothetical protein